MRTPRLGTARQFDLPKLVSRAPYQRRAAEATGVTEGWRGWGRTQTPANRVSNADGGATRVLESGGRAMSTTGQKPGKGTYSCTDCGQTVVLDDNTDTLPPCP